MTSASDVLYVLDRIAIQDLIAKYGLGQDLHQGDNNDQDLTAQWSEVFSSDAVIDASDVGQGAEIGLADYIDFMRGADRKPTEGLGRLFGQWQHREGYATVTIDGDTATAISPFFHTHETRDGQANVIHTGLWHDRLERRAEGWRIVHRRLENGFFNTFARIPEPVELLER
ncbi:SnoaL-like domain-containing protein [Streptomyces misionensis]|uniref:SnoaL-like domain-containing protein n=1 Tax=Streptomyces misionensis TaxID=67331 RepID=A0A1H4QZM0_9ACTN|nr:nuclear transport factor 2 family protein [Streptomyces misionensis]SEC25076.1 SnoaL-like domain-containing protein [Streptomyces misionensis]